MKKVKKVLSFLLVFCMILTIMPMGVYATDLEESSAAADDLISEATPTPVPAEDIPADDPVEEDPTPAPTEQPTPKPTEEPASYGITPYSGEVKSVPLDTGTFYRIFHLDCGRKYFSVDQIKALIDTLAANNYTHIELAVGNDGLRFLLDDMSVTANDTTYTNDAVKAGIQAGNKAYYNAGTYNELTQTEMDTIISYANEKGIGIIPLINTPGHMDAILNCMKSVGISNPAYNNSARTVDVTNTAAVNFTLALVNKYIQYFAGKGCTIFNMGCDEYANDVSNSGFAGLISSGKYGSFITYVNNMAAQVKAADMVPMAFNDGIYYNSNTSSGTFDTDIAIAYWTSGWGGYSPASASFLAEKDHKIISTNDAWYYVLGRQAGNSSGYTIATAQNGVQNTACTDIPGGNGPTAVGCMICLWCDTPSASYSNTEVNNVTGLLTTFAENNPGKFVASSGDGDNTGDSGSSDLDERTITVTVGQTATDTIEGADYSNNIVETELDKNIATVSAEYEQVTGGTEEVKATSITSGSSYYIKNSSGQYLSSSATWVSDISSAALWTATSGYTGYTLKNGNNYLRYRKRSLSTTTDSWSATPWSFNNGTFISYINGYTLGDAYTVTTTAPVNATTVTFTGVAVGTTYVTVGNTRYTINVVAEDLSTVTPLTVEYWITNLPVTADGVTSKDISAQSAYGEAGVDVSTLVPATGTYAYGSVVYWKGTVLDSSNKQTTDAGDDETADGKDFKLIRYYNGSWQYFYEADGTWNTISSTDQVVIYWLQPTEVTKEITTLVKDWGFAPDAQGDSENKVALTVAVVYPDGTVSPAEGDMYSTSTTLFNYWSGRDIGLVAPVNNSNYEIAKITVTDGTRDQSGTGKWGANDTITWEKVTNEAGEKWYNETTYWDETVGGTPMVNGAVSDITWSNYNTAKLVLIYLKPVHYDTNLIVKWVDDSAAGALISTMEVAVSSDGTPITFYNGLKQTSALPTEGDGGTFTLDDDAYVTNSSNVNQTFNKNISTVPGVADQYKSGLYQYVSADLSANGMTLTLHYNINSAKLSKSYVVDFGLPVNIPLSELVENADDVESVEIVSGNAKVNEDKSITYQPEAIMSGTETVRVKIIYGSDPKTIAIGFIPATTVYYEEGFATYSEGWTGGSSKGTGTQTASVAGSKALYGFDSKYANETVGPSNGTEAKCDEGSTGQTATFEFTGTGVEIYTNNTRTSGSVMASIYNAETETHVKTYIVHTAMKDGDSDATHGQNVTAYNVPIISARDLAYGQYKVVIKHVKSSASDTTIAPVSLDGFRVHGTLALNTPAYVDDLEDNPTFIELRDQVLSAVGVTDNGDPSNQYASQIAKNVYSQVYSSAGATAGAVVIDINSYTDGKNAQDLLDNGPKNELYLQPNQAVVFKVTTNRVVQIGLKALNAATTYTIDSAGSQTLSTSTDMFYTVLNKAASESTQTITITNTGEGILSITLVKICDDPNAAFASLTEEDLIPALLSLGFEDKATSTPEPTAEPTIEPTATPEPTAEPTPVVTPTPAPTNPPKPVVPNNPIQDFFNAVRNILNKWFGW